MRLPAGIHFGFGEVRHKRLRPRVHAFRYRAFFVRAPLEALESAGGSLIFSVNRPALISLCASDHGDGGSPRLWLTGLLAEAGVEADGEIWLHAFPRVLGYAFKPVSFWFCHAAQGSLKAVVAEVHNTFGERHVYLLADPQGQALSPGAELCSTKAFHVSPFCEIAGRYRFRFVNRADRAFARIDHDDPSGPLLLTSLSGRLVDASARQRWRALLAYPLFSLGVILRIHWQAFRLWRAGVPFHTKPAAPETLFTRGAP